MVPIKNLAILLLILLAQSSARGRPRSENADTPRPSLFVQSAREALNRDFPGRDISFLLLDARTGEVLAARWEDSDIPIPLGSLTKPFAALAYGEHHDFLYPQHTCHGTETGCWRPNGHGKVDLTAAIAYSCNSYFRMLTANLTASDVSSTASRFGLDLPGQKAFGGAFAGLGPEWKISPLRMGRAYLELFRERGSAAVRQIVDGMAASGQQGTGAEVDRALRSSHALVKTGTAVCTHSPHAPGDGFTVALFPADDPKILLMVRVHGIPGAQAAKTAGAMLHRIGD